MIHATDDDRPRVVTEALTWLRTPYHHEGRIKGVGVDCGQFPILVYSCTGLIENFVPESYPIDWHLHHSEERYRMTVERFLLPAQDPGYVPRPGDFVLYRFGRCFSHGGIVIEWPAIIHANRNARCVELTDGTQGVMSPPRPRLTYPLVPP